MMEKVNFLGLDLVSASYNEVLSEIFIYLTADFKETRFVFTPNNEIYVEASQNSKFKEALQSAWLNLPDSTGVKLASGVKQRLTGVDMTMRFLAQNKDFKVFLLGGADGVAKEVASRYENIVGYSSAPASDVGLVDEIVSSGAEVLFVAFGAPKQELWLAENVAKLKGVKLAFGVGGTFDFIVGKQKRAPWVMRKLGLEWLFRFYKNPKRAKRMYNALVKFPILVMKNKV